MTALDRNTRTAFLAGGLGLAMLGLGYASVPLYRLFCQVTGLGGTTQKADASAMPAAVLGKSVTVRFDANHAPNLPWTFGPEEATSTVTLGARNIAFYSAKNLSAKAITGTATFNVTPTQAGKYFNKIQCFCFNQQTLKPGEAVRMPVTYFVDPAILNDPDAKDISEITLSYTFYPVDDANKGS